MKDCNCILSNTINICDKISTTRHLQCLVINDICIYDYSIFDNVWSLTVTVTVQSRGEDSLVETESGRGQSASSQTRDQATSLTHHIPHCTPPPDSRDILGLGLSKYVLLQYWFRYLRSMLQNTHKLFNNSFLILGQQPYKNPRVVPIKTLMFICLTAISIF